MGFCRIETWENQISVLFLERKSIRKKMEQMLPVRSGTAAVITFKRSGKVLNAGVAGFFRDLSNGQFRVL